MTGATAGIGLEFCHQLAEVGFNIVLVSRSLERLKSSEAEVKQKHPNVKTHIVQADFAEDTSLDLYTSIA